MTREQRVDVLKQIGSSRKSDVLVYYLASRPGFNAHMSNDALPVIYEHLLALSQRKDKARKLDLFMHTHGGNAEVPWPLVNMCRELYDDLAVLLPGPCYSAGTTVALGADEIVMTPYANLGPIDPTITVSDGDGTSISVAVEDVSAFVEFVREGAGITAEEHVAALIGLLAGQTMPLTLGRVTREQKFSRMVADKLLQRRKTNPPDGAAREKLIAALTTDIGHHGHAVSRREAAELGLPVTKADGALAETMWALHLEYEERAGGRKPPSLPSNKPSVETKVQLGFIESEVRYDVFDLLDCWRRRYEAPQLSVNVNVQMPVSLAQALEKGQAPDPDAVQQFMQRAADEAIAAAQQQLLQTVPQRLERSATALGWNQRYR